MQKIFRLPALNLEVEIGKVARLADGAAWVRSGNTVVLATVVEATNDTFPGFLPLTVEYRERMSAAGKIPGGYIKREGKLSDQEVLNSRLIDRPIRPLFPVTYFNEIQLLATIYSSDGEVPVNVLAILASSIALTVSKIPFLGPVGAVQAARVNGAWVFNTTDELRAQADSVIVVAGTKDGICMVEGSCNDLAEKELIDVLFDAHELIKQQVEWQLSIQQELNIEKNAAADDAPWEAFKQKMNECLPAQFADTLFVKTKSERSEATKALEEKIVTHFAEELEQGVVTKSLLMFLFDSLLKDALPEAIVRRQERIDFRKFNQVRPIDSEVGMLPCVHGSSLFRRGETQALSSLTLGTAQDAQKVEGLAGLTERSFMLHYNFLPFCTGEVKPMRGTSRRETGHGYLAQSSFTYVLPSQESFPYTIRSVVDILESNGSSSMASVCSTTLALMDAGVPLKAMVGGVAMGAFRDKAGEFHILTDILGKEDSFGLMDFKVTGTESGIMAFQLDIKDKVGLPRELFEKALEQARLGRLHILAEMRKTLGAPRAELSQLAPRVLSFRVPQDKIGMIIGPAGKNIKEIIAKTNTQIDIEDEGIVKIYSKDKAAAQAAESWIKLLIGDVEVGSKVMGIIRRFTEFGIFVELVPGKDGLVHISTIAKELQKDLTINCKVNDPLEVKIVAYDRETGRIRLVAPTLEKK